MPLIEEFPGSVIFSFQTLMKFPARAWYYNRKTDVLVSRTWRMANLGYIIRFVENLCNLRDGKVTE